MAASPTVPVAPLYTLSRMILDESCITEIRNSALHKLIENLNNGKDRDRFEECEDLIDLLMKAFCAAIHNFKKSKECCDDALTCLGKGIYGLVYSVPGELLYVMTLDETIFEFIVDAIANKNLSTTAMLCYSSACRDAVEWVDRYPQARRQMIYDKYAGKIGNNLHRLEFNDIAEMIQQNGIGEYAFNNNAVINLIEQKCMTATEFWEKHNANWAAFNLLYDVSRDREKLEDLLGRGFLVATNTVYPRGSGEFPYNSFTAKIMETIIEFFPAYKAMIKQLLNEIVKTFPFEFSGMDFLAELAATIEIQPTKRAVYHLQWEEEHEESTADTIESSEGVTSSQERITKDPRDVLVQNESLGEQTKSETESTEDQGSLGFDALHRDVLVRIVGLLTVDEIAAFRGTVKQAHLAVQSFCSNLAIKKLVEELWPEKNHQFGTLNMILREARLLAAWASSGLIAVNFTGIQTMTSGQLEAAFGSEPRHSVKQLVLTDVIALPSTWTMLARLFPSITTLIFTAVTSTFPNGIEDRNEGRKATVKNCGELKAAGLLDEERGQTLSCIAKLFCKIEKVQME